MLRSWLPLLAVILLAVAGCTPVPNGALPPVDLSGRKARVVVTTTMIADLARNIGGKHVEVTALMPAGVDPHQYKPSAGDSRAMQQADLVLYNGLHLEGKMADVFEELGKRMRVVAVAGKLGEGDLIRAGEGHEGSFDPHIWFDVSLWARTIDVVRDALNELDPAHAAEYGVNADRYRKQLMELHDEVKATAAKIPPERRVLVTAHDAFHYFGRAYGFEVRGLQGVSTNSEPSTRDVTELANFIAARRIPAIFGETSVPDRGVQAVQQAVRKGSNYEVKFLAGALYSDSLGEANGPAGTYIGMVKHNVGVIARALGE